MFAGYVLWTRWDALAREKSYHFHTEPDFPRIIKETGLGADEGAWVVKVEREDGLPKGFGGERLMDGHIHSAIFSNKKISFGGYVNQHPNICVKFIDDPTEIIRTIDIYWTSKIGGVGVRAYENKDGTVRICCGTHSISGADGLFDKILHTLLLNSGVKIMPFKLSNGEFKAPKE